MRGQGQGSAGTENSHHSNSTNKNFHNSSSPPKAGYNFSITTPASQQQYFKETSLKPERPPF
jgi:hypothetical protein